MPNEIHALARRAGQAKDEGKFSRVVELAKEALRQSSDNYIQVNQVFREVAGIDLSQGVLCSSYRSQLTEVSG